MTAAVHIDDAVACLEEISEHGDIYIVICPRREALRRRAAEAYARGIRPDQIRVTPVEEQR